jgi:hypothetical protein
MNRRLERESKRPLRGVAPERIVTVSFAVSRIFGVGLSITHRIVLRRD